MEHCRTASPDDIPRLVDLARELRHELSDMRGGTLWADRDAAPEPLDAAFTAWIADPAALVLAGCIDEVIIGIGVVQVEPLRDGSRLGVVRELYVEEAARSVGVGEAMTDRIVEFCRAHDCIGVDAVALPGHRATKNFFEEQGFTARALTMHTSLHEPA
ncbi:MAG: GNAT family N-acetyltransferase [Acidimicrobiia bacterium]